MRNLCLSSKPDSLGGRHSFLTSRTLQSTRGHIFTRGYCEVLETAGLLVLVPGSKRSESLGVS